MTEVYMCVNIDYVGAAQSTAVSVSTFSPSSTNTESSLNLHNLNTALETLPDEEWYNFGVWLNVPWSWLDKIRSQYSTERERKSALLHTYLTSYPAPSWQHVADALYRFLFHAVLERLQTMFPTGKKMCQLCYVRWFSVPFKLWWADCMCIMTSTVEPV